MHHRRRRPTPPTDLRCDQQRSELPRPYKCPFCEKAFHRLEHQTRHIRTHTGEKPHTCSFIGCSKRFSRSDELTRHSRIHSNPNSRRSNKAQHLAALAAAAAGTPVLFEHTSPAYSHTPPSHQRTPNTHIMMPPPPKVAGSKSAPSSHVGSPNVSPPHTYLGLHTPAAFPRTFSSPVLTGNPFDLNALVQSTGPYNGTAHLRGYQMVPQGLSRCHSHLDDDPYVSHRYTKKSRPNSPISTAPSSPVFSCSPTPECTPVATPAHSPRLYPREFEFSMQLPGLRHLSLRQTPALQPMEIADPFSASSVRMPASTPLPSLPSTTPKMGCMRLGDIINRFEATSRHLPTPTVPRLAVNDLLNSTSNRDD